MDGVASTVFLELAAVIGSPVADKEFFGLVLAPLSQAAPARATTLGGTSGFYVPLMLPISYGRAASWRGTLLP